MINGVKERSLKHTTENYTPNPTVYSHLFFSARERAQGIHRSGVWLQFFMPMEEGECYWTAKISVPRNAAYYCVSETLLGLLRQILQKGQTHFPGLLEVKSVNLEISREMLANTPVPSHIAERAYKKIPKKEYKEAKIPASVSIPTDVELMPIVELGEDKVKGFIITGRKVPAKYEVLAVATAKTKQKIKHAHIEEENGKVFWVVASNYEEIRFDLTTGERLKVQPRARAQWGSLESGKIGILEELSKESLGVEKLKFCYECSACTGSCPCAWVFPKHYNPKILLQKISLGLEDVLKQVGLWMCTRCYRCYRRCPQGLNLPEIFSATRDLTIEGNYLPNAEGKLKEVLKLVKEEIPLAAVYGWLCLRPHEGGNNRKIEKLAPKALRSFVADYTKEKIAPTPKKKIHREKIAIIGSGPAGLSAAYKLVKMGYPVTVFESLPEAGGMLRVGIPEYRLPKSVLDIEIELMKKLEIEIKTDTKIGRDLTMDDLFLEGYKAVFIAIGAHKSRELRIEGENLEGVVHALYLLKEFNTGRRVRVGERVVIIGGGDVAVDAARTALRLGSKDVNIFYRRSRAEMPANPSGVKEAEKEGVKIRFLIAPRKILGEDGRVAALECVRMRLGELDETGRRRPIPIEGSEFTVQLDTIILAIGESPNLFSMSKEIEVAKDNTIKVNPLTLETSMPGVFAGGDVVSGPATVMEAIAAGIKVASSIDSYLRREISALAK